MTDTEREPRTTDRQIVAFAKALLKEIPPCTGCDFDHGWDDHVLSIAAANEVPWYGEAAAPAGPAVPAGLDAQAADLLRALAERGIYSRGDLALVGAEPGLDEAWKAVEALLPIERDDTGGWNSWRVGLMKWRAIDTHPWHYRTVALVPEHGNPRAWADGPTPAAALLALAARLGSVKPEGDEG